MSGLDNLIAFIDNGGTRSGSESGADRRRILNEKRKKGKERRTVFVD
jgi:hypothetical protein